MDDKPPIQTRAPGKVIVGIVGGSVAYWFSVYGVETLRAQLQQSPPFEAKSFVFVRLALGGYKQPQQLMVLTYLLALGAQFDIVINIDGFNEVALPIAEDLPSHVFPFFPRSWFLRVNTLPEPGISVLVGRIQYLRTRREQAAAMVKGALHYSATVDLIWKYLDNALAASLSQAELELESYHPKASSSSYVACGPTRRYESDKDLYTDLAAVWQRGSVQLQRLCVANGIRYFHFLQPNQYVAGTKPMASAEIKQAIAENQPYRKGAEEGYPYLIAAGAGLRRQGVQFHDLTRIFSETTEPIYVDTCCHLNQQGNDMLARRIAEVIRQDFETRPTLTPALH
jgi:hypothetical protein